MFKQNVCFYCHLHYAVNHCLRSVYLFYFLLNNFSIYLEISGIICIFAPINVFGVLVTGKIL